MKILLVDDEALRDRLTDALRRDDFSVLGAADGQQALLRWETDQPDLVLLEAKLPKVDGFEVCRRIRQASQTPVIMVGTRSGEADIVRGLQAGADDYVTRPFSTTQLVARMRAVLRRCRYASAWQPASEVRAGDIVLDLQAHRAARGGRVVQLTPCEFRVLHMLAMNEGRVVPYARLVEYGWGYYDEHNSSLLKTHVSHVRTKLGLSAAEPGGIRSVLGVGYALTRAN